MSPTCAQPAFIENSSPARYVRTSPCTVRVMSLEHEPEDVERMRVLGVVAPRLQLVHADLGKAFGFQARLEARSVHARLLYRDSPYFFFFFALARPFWPDWRGCRRNMLIALPK